MRYLACVCALCLFANAVHAQDNSVTDLLQQVGNYLDTVAEDVAASEAAANKSNEIPLNVFGVPQEVVGVIESNVVNKEEKGRAFPSCENLLEKVRQTIQAVQQQEVADNIYQYRRQHLIYKGIRELVEVDVSTFHPNDNREVANRMITLKINDGILPSSFKICRGNNKIVEKDIFVLMYPEQERIKAEVLNFIPETPLSFYISAQQ